MDTSVSNPAPTSPDTRPHLSTSPHATQLVIDGRPRLLLGGQAHNSVPSSPSHVTDAWEHIAGMGASLVIGNVSWSLVEPEEGTYDFTAVDAQIAAAQAQGLRLVLIWFGAFKNAGSTYAPSWVRADRHRFPRADLRAKHVAWTYEGQTRKPVLSVFSSELLEADRRAFVRLVEHLVTADPGHVVVMLQVENEVGVLGDSRDRSAAALEAWDSAVPEALLEYLARRQDLLRPELAHLWAERGCQAEGTWAEVFGESWEADEVFMAWAFGSYAEALAAAGKAAKALPMFVNAWLGPQAGAPEAGYYPSGGPAARVLDVWKAAAPSLDLIAPDIYVPDVKSVLADYARDDNPLFVPEAQFRTGSVLYAVGHHRAIGFSVFGVEDGRTDSQLSRAFDLLMSMEDAITRAQADGRIEGILLDEEQPQQFTLGGFEVTVRGSRDLLRNLLLDAGIPHPPPPPVLPDETRAGALMTAAADGRPFGLMIAETEDQFLLVGQGLTVDFSHTVDDVEIDLVEEGRYVDGAWRPGRVLNGDERLFVVPMDEIGAARIRLLRLPVAGSGTGVQDDDT